MLKKLFTIFVILLACDLFFVACGSPKNCTAKFKSLKNIVAATIKDPIFSIDKSNTGAIKIDSLFINTYLVFDQINCVRNTNKGFIIQTANAFSKTVNSINFPDSILNYNTVTLQDYNNSHLAGSSLNDITSHYTYELSTLRKNKTSISTTDLINDYNRQFTNSRLTIFGGNIYHQSILTQKPDVSNTGVHLAVTCTFKSGLVLTDTIEPFSIIY